MALAESDVQLDWLLVPKVEDAADLHALQSWIGHRYDRLTALIETPYAVENAMSIARAGGKLAALMLGGADLAAELGAQFGWDGLLHARGRLVNSARAAGLQAWDVPHIDLKKPDDLRRRNTQGSGTRLQLQDRDPSAADPSHSRGVRAVARRTLVG